METPVVIYPILTSFLGALLIGLLNKRQNIRDIIVVSIPLIKFFFVFFLLIGVLSGKELQYTLISIFPHISLKFRVDKLGILFATVASFLWILTSFYSWGYIRSLSLSHQTRYYVCFALALAGTVGVAFSSNVFTLFLFYEVITLSTYPLVIHKHSEEAFSSGRKYLIYLLGTSLAFFLPAIFLVYSVSGTLEFVPGGVIPPEISKEMIIIIFVLFILGITKTAIIPFHSWLPSAMVAPTPVSALLHAVAVVKVGVFSVYRIIFYLMGEDILQNISLNIFLAYFVSFTIIVASLIALLQDNLKLRLAYSTISQLSLIILGAALLNQQSISGGMYHFVFHAFSKITLFFGAGAIYVASHKKNISEMEGIGKKMPFTMAAFTVGALSMIGVPFTCGFISKWYILQGTLEVNLFFTGVLGISTLLNALYFLPIIYSAFFKNSDGEQNFKEAPLSMLIPMVIIATMVVMLFFLLPFYPGD